MAKTFGIQFESAGTYLVGTPSEHMHVTFDELMGFFGGIVGLLDYGLTCKVIKAALRRLRSRRFWDPLDNSHQPVWIDNSGPTFYEIRHGPDSIRVTPAELEASRFGRVIKKQWDGGMNEPEFRWVLKLLLQAFFAGIWRRLLEYLNLRKVGGGRRFLGMFC